MPTMPVCDSYIYYYLFVAPMIRRLKCDHSDRGWKFVANKNPTGFHDMYLYTTPYRRTVKERVDIAISTTPPQLHHRRAEYTSA